MSVADAGRRTGFKGRSALGGLKGMRAILIQNWQKGFPSKTKKAAVAAYFATR
jgi:hypothetical protein